MASNNLKRWEVHWYNITECVKTEVVEAATKEEAEKKARMRYPDCKWPATMCSATLIE